MGEAKRKRVRVDRLEWPRADAHRGVIDLQMLPAVPDINGARIRALTGDTTIPEAAEIILKSFRATVGSRVFSVGFCIGDKHKFSPIGIAVIERLTIEAPKDVLHIVPVLHADIAWDVVLRHLRTFRGGLLLFTFPDSDVYDAGVAEMYYSNEVRQLDADGVSLGRLTMAQRQEIRMQKAALLSRPPPPTLYSADWLDQADAPWIFRMHTPTGKVLRTAVWDGRRDYAREIPAEIVRWVGGDRIAIVQVDRPVSIDRRSSLDLTYKLSADFDGVVHWARDTATFHSIVQSFVRLDLESVSPPTLPADWVPAVTILAAG